MNLNRALRCVTALLVLVNASALVALYVAAYRCDRAQRAIIRIQKDIEQEDNAGLTIQAEWSYLNRPSRLAALSGRYLDLKPLNARQIRCVCVQLPDM